MHIFTKRRPALWGLPALAVALAVILVRPAPVQVFPATTETIQRTVLATGTVHPGRESWLRAPAAGRVEEVPAEGVRVQAGEILLTLADDATAAAAAQARAGVRQARARLDLAVRGAGAAERLRAEAELQRAREEHQAASREANRTTALYQAGAVSEQDWEQAQSALEQSAAALAAAEAAAASLSADPLKIREAEAALAAAEADLQQAVALEEQRRVKAPHSGTVLEVFVRSGEWVPAGELLLRLGDTDTLEVHVVVDEAYAGELKPGAPAWIAADGDSPGVESVLDRTSPAVDPEQASITAYIKTGGESFHPGQTVSVEILLEERTGLTIPSTAVKTGGNETPRVFVVEDGRARERAVTLGWNADGRVEVLDGLQEGDPVIRTADRVRPGQRVREDKDS